MGQVGQLGRVGPALMSGTALLIILTAEPRSLSGYVTAYALVAILSLATIGLANPVKFGWAFRGWLQESSQVCLLTSVLN